MSKLTVRTVAVLKDNYTYLIVDRPRRSCLIIDPPVVEPIIEVMGQEKLTPTAIWLTHNHGDHVAGVPWLLEHYPTLEVVCSARDADSYSFPTRAVQEGDSLEFGKATAYVQELPGHAEGHLGYYFPKSGDLFCGDVIFGASCGAVFGNSYEPMYRSVRRVSELPESTKLWVGHEYTENNLRFAEAVLGSDALSQRKSQLTIPSVPLSLAEERRTNPFMRLDTAEVLDYLKLEPGDPLAAFTALRIAKNNF